MVFVLVFLFWTLNIFFSVSVITLNKSKCKLGFYLFLLKLRNRWLVGVSFQKETVTAYSPKSRVSCHVSLKFTVTNTEIRKITKPVTYNPLKLFKSRLHILNIVYITQSPIIFTRNIFSRMIFCVIWHKCIKCSWNQLSPEFWKDWIYYNA